MEYEDPEEAELIVMTVVRRYGGHCWWRDKQEMIQDAHLAVIQARQWFDPQVGVPFADYAKRAVAFALKRKLWAASFAATVPEREQRTASESGAGRGVPTAIWDEGGGTATHSVPKPLQALFDPPTLLERRRWKQRVWRALEAALVPPLGPDAALVIPVLTGEETPEAVAERARLPQRRVHKLTCRARSILRGSRELRELWKEGEF